MMVSSFIGLYARRRIPPEVDLYIVVGSYRIVPGFLVQTGDKTGTGAGGESFYGGS